MLIDQEKMEPRCAISTVIVVVPSVVCLLYVVNCLFVTEQTPEELVA